MMATISNQTCAKCQNCGEWTNYADDPNHKARESEVERYRNALNEIARHTGSDDPCRRLVDIARAALTVHNTWSKTVLAARNEQLRAVLEWRMCSDPWPGGDMAAVDWWLEHSTPFNRPAVALPIQSVLCPEEKVGWVDLAECNEVPNACGEPGLTEPGKD